MLTRSQYEELRAIDQGYFIDINPVYLKAVEADLKAHDLINELGELTEKGKKELFECEEYD